MSSSKLNDLVIHEFVNELERLYYASPKDKRKTINEASDAFIHFPCLCAANVINGRTPLSPNQFKKLKRHHKTLKRLESKRLPVSTKKRAINQKGGFLTSIIGPLLGVLFK